MQSLKRENGKRERKSQKERIYERKCGRMRKREGSKKMKGNEKDEDKEEEEE